MPKIPEQYKIHRYFSKEDIQEAKRLRNKGLSYQKIAQILGFSKFTIMYHLCPEQKEKSLLRHKLLSPEVKRKSVYNYRSRFQKITGVNYSTAYDREHRIERNKRKVIVYWKNKIINGL